MPRTIENRVTRLEEDFQALTSTVLDIHDIVSGHTVMLTDLRTDVRGLTTDVGVLKTDVATLKTDVSTLKTDVAEHTGLLHEILRRLPEPSQS